MKVIYELDPFEDSEELKRIQQANHMYLALWDFSQHLRSKLKHEDLSESNYAIYDSISSKFYECLQEYGVEL